MYLAAVHIQNYRCFADQTIQFSPGVNVLLGENNAGKTTVIKALGIVLDQRGRKRPGFYDFRHPSNNFHEPPTMTITVTFCSSENDTIEDQALVATWLTKLDDPWEAQVTYKFSLEPEHEEQCRTQLSAITNFAGYQRVVESFLNKYVSHTYGGNPENLQKAEGESLEKISFDTLEALRDADRELFAGSNPLLKRLLHQVRDYGQDAAQKAERNQAFQILAGNLGEHIRSRIDLDLLLQLVTDTGAMEGGKPHLAKDLTQQDVINALRLHVTANGISLPAENNGLGYNNLIYISLILASLDHKTDQETQGPNATLFPVLCIEEPEAHLHPALQYKLLKHLQQRIGTTGKNRQIFITTHSTHITSASPLDQIICLTIPTASSTPRVAYPGKCFSDTREGKDSKAYVERYLDATKSNLLFSKGVILVEGIAEQLLLPVFAECYGYSLEEYHVALIPVDGLTFKHFLPLFGAGFQSEKVEYALKRPVACLVDGDPQRCKDGEDFKRCYPYQLAETAYTPKPVSDVISNLQTQRADHENILIAPNNKTLEYDLAFTNYTHDILVTEECTHAAALRLLIADPISTPKGLADKLLRIHQDTAHITHAAERNAHIVATCYLECLQNAKGSHALALAKALKDAKEKSLTIPAPIIKAIRFACRQPLTPNATGTA